MEFYGICLGANLQVIVCIVQALICIRQRHCEFACIQGMIKGFFFVAQPLSLRFREI